MWQRPINVLSCLRQRTSATKPLGALSPVLHASTQFPTFYWNYYFSGKPDRGIISFRYAKIIELKETI